MKRFLIVYLVLAAGVVGCGGEDDAQTGQNPHDVWFASPTQVVEGIMHAYETRNDSLYAAFLADDFRYYFEPQGADSADILGWGKEEEVVATGSLFKTPDVESLDYSLSYGEARAASGTGRDGWMVVPISGGEMLVSVKNKEAMQVELNRQEIILRPLDGASGTRWEVVEWHDYPAPEPVSGGE